MTDIKSPSAVEEISGHIITESALTLVGALSGGPVAALLPILSNSLASGRYKKRVEEALHDISQTLQMHDEKICNLTDEQYKLVSENILALLQTTNQKKIEYLRRAIEGCLQIDDLEPQESVVLSRIMRDISAEEADFLVSNFRYDRVRVASMADFNLRGNVYKVKPDTRESLIVSGLVSLGLLVDAEPTYDDAGYLRYSPIVSKLLVLLGVKGPKGNA